MERLIIAIDGPSGSGKSTLGKAIAERLGYLYIDSGAVYRAVGCKAIESGLQLTDSAAVAAIAEKSDIKLLGKPHQLEVFLDGENVTSRIRLPDASNAASVVGTLPEVRAAVVEKLRQMSRDGGVVMDGRDIGTKVFPYAQIKLFIEASDDVRADRRWKEERELGRDVSLGEVKKELAERDRRDRERTATPLVPADDALVIDTSEMSLDSVIARSLEIIESYG